MFICKSCMFICKIFIFYSKIYAFIRKGFVLICEIIIFLPINMSSKGFCTLCIYLFVYFPYLHVLIEILGCFFYFYMYMYVSYLTMFFQNLQVLIDSCVFFSYAKCLFLDIVIPKAHQAMQTNRILTDNH